ncbi:alpha/beta fold hydrolase [Nocardia sp. NPDC005366]|uniref:alpha/beta fold hydrolase n=1 Tax=Nocardia sp. NPDC005366 TaxID=3156878 RepID=UPI0033B36B12
MSTSSFFIPGSESGGIGSMFVRKYSPERSTGAAPVVLVHGGGGEGTDWTTTLDGRPGWAPRLADAGHPVYVVDRPAHGRSPYDASMGPLAPMAPSEFLAPMFFPPPLGPGAHPTAHRHTQWPWGREPGDPAFDRFISTKHPMPADSVGQQLREKAALAELLRQVGPAVLIAHSNGGPGAWLAADATPENVLAFVAAETLGPPFLHAPELGISLEYGLTSAPLTFDPPVENPDELNPVIVDEGPPGPLDLLLPEPRRALPNLARFPIAVLTAEASVFRLWDQLLVAFLAAAGCQPELVRLEDHGVHGNAHGFMQEANSDEGALASRWDAHTAGCRPCRGQSIRKLYGMKADRVASVSRFVEPRVSRTARVEFGKVMAARPSTSVG